MSNNNNNNNVSHNNNNNSWSCGSPPTSDSSGCSHCQQSCAARTAKAAGNGSCGTGASTVYSSVPPIQVTAKVLFGSVSAISALNAERKKKA